MVEFRSQLCELNIYTKVDLDAGRILSLAGSFDRIFTSPSFLFPENDYMFSTKDLRNWQNVYSKAAFGRIEGGKFWSD